MDDQLEGPLVPVLAQALSPLISAYILRDLLIAHPLPSTLLLCGVVLTTSLPPLSQLRQLPTLVLVVHSAVVILGGPLIASAPLTLFLALLMLPMAPKGAVGALALARALIEDAEARCVLIVAWLSCATLPLDWDRPWQVFPVPIVIGAALGKALTPIATVLTKRSKEN